MTRSEAINTLRDAAGMLECAEWAPDRADTVEDVLRHVALVMNPFEPWQQVAFDLYLATRMAWGPDGIDKLPRLISDGVRAGVITTDQAAVRYLRESAQQLTHKS